MERYFAELLVGSEFVIGQTRCRKVGRYAFIVLHSQQSIIVGNRFFKVVL
jgi:hypothetical protein